MGIRGRADNNKTWFERFFKFDRNESNVSLIDMSVNAFRRTKNCVHSKLYKHPSSKCEFRTTYGQTFIFSTIYRVRDLVCVITNSNVVHTRIYINVIKFAIFMKERRTENVHKAAGLKRNIRSFILFSLLEWLMPKTDIIPGARRSWAWWMMSRTRKHPKSFHLDSTGVNVSSRPVDYKNSTFEVEPFFIRRRPTSTE